MAYVPPHLRNKAPEGAAAPPPARPQGDSGSSLEALMQRMGTGGNRFDRGPPGGGGDFGRRGAGFGFSGGGRDFDDGGRGGGRRWDEGPGGGRGSRERNKRLEIEIFGEPPAETEEEIKAGINFDKYDNIPVEVSGKDAPSSVNDFKDLGLPDVIMQNIELSRYKRPTPIQKTTIPISVTGRDLMACAQTGSGKTASFLIPMVTKLLKDDAPPPPPGGRHSRALPHALILAPTRELASQIHAESRKFCYCTGLATVVVYGGADIRDQLRQLERGSDMVVATPGRLVDLLERGRIGLSSVRILALDEADRMLDMGFEPQIRRIVEQEDMPRERQTLMFSATFPPPIQRLAGDFLRDYIFVTVGRVGSTTDFITQKVEFVEERDKLHVVLDLLTNVSGLTLIFVETKRAADELEYRLTQAGFPATSIHGDRTQAEREHALRTFKAGKTPVLVATDVAARGLDVPNVMHVINYDFPSDIDDYTHRIGRTGRAGHSGLATTLINDRANGRAIGELADMLRENNMELPTWLERMAQSSHFGSSGGGRGGRRHGGGG
eukprot:CAMPEP_0206002428 /NCGR_PEP_ID=MMETSP1464-20131121/2726_1 /ASSEMBLY_ACC=CAM_ASM_001124 /TAXON_ID=119497 /ORGANISM="Exanthemachrysis gayraliae, Strain RCC1523" /LENGTH=550 /DNA_ID=CAMNT_0053375767 /DNA_START=57 /DNA_END=1705 /DNA_ORIENTATION=+